VCVSAGRDRLPGRRTNKPPRPRAPPSIYLPSQTRDFPGSVSLLTVDISKRGLRSLAHTKNLPRFAGRGGVKCPCIRHASSGPNWAVVFALMKDEFLLAARTHVVVDALFAFGLVLLPMVAMVLLMFLIGSADPTVAVANTADGTGMLILPP
jgi:hypothetical protein